MILLNINKIAVALGLQLFIIVFGLISWRIQFTFQRQETIFSKILPLITKLKDLHNYTLEKPAYWIELSDANKAIDKLEDLSATFFQWFGDEYRKPLNELISKMKEIKYDDTLKSDANFANERYLKIKSANTFTSAIKRTFQLRNLK